MTPAMPITIPNIVRNDLSLFDPKIESAVIIYCARPETALLAKCEDRACQGTIAEKSAILTDVEYMSPKKVSSWDSTITHPYAST